jgi:putative membrane protein
LLALKTFLQRWLVNTLAVLVAAHLVPGIRYDTVGGLLVASLLLGILNSFVRPVLMLISLPLLVLTLGLFMLLINALLLYWVGRIKGFHVDTFWAAFWGALVISIVSMIVNALLGPKRLPSGASPASPSDRRRDEGGHVIDV